MHGWLSSHCGKHNANRGVLKLNDVAGLVEGPVYPLIHGIVRDCHKVTVGGRYDSDHNHESIKSESETFVSKFLPLHAMMNFDVAPVEVVTREFVAVILAGFGNE
jgi:hypothetical protein